MAESETEMSGFKTSLICRALSYRVDINITNVYRR